MRRGQDTMNPRTHCDVMVASAETDAETGTEIGAKADVKIGAKRGAKPTTKVHPFWYARVLGVFHAKVLHTDSNARNRSIQHVEFLWVRWFGIEQDYEYGPGPGRLPKIGFVPDTEDNAFGFLDPSLVLRGCHLVPVFANGRTSGLLRTSLPSAGRSIGEVDDWVNYYVIM